MKRAKLEIKREKLDTFGRPLKGDEGRPTNGSRTLGTRRGQHYHTTAVLKDAIIYAAQKVGSDGEGLDGLVGYLMRLAIDEPKSYASLLGRVIPLHVTTATTTEVTFRSKEEVQAELKARGIVVERIHN